MYDIHCILWRPSLGLYESETPYECCLEGIQILHARQRECQTESQAVKQAGVYWSVPVEAFSLLSGEHTFFSTIRFSTEEASS